MATSNFSSHSNTILLIFLRTMNKRVFYALAFHTSPVSRLDLTNALIGLNYNYLIFIPCKYLQNPLARIFNGQRKVR